MGYCGYGEGAIGRTGTFGTPAKAECFKDVKVAEIAYGSMHMLIRLGAYFAFIVVVRSILAYGF